MPLISAAVWSFNGQVIHVHHVQAHLPERLDAFNSESTVVLVDILWEVLEISRLKVEPFADF